MYFYECIKTFYSDVFGPLTFVFKCVDYFRFCHNGLLHGSCVFLLRSDSIDYGRSVWKGFALQMKLAVIKRVEVVAVFIRIGRRTCVLATKSKVLVAAMNAFGSVRLLSDIQVDKVKLAHFEIHGVLQVYYGPVE